MTDTFTIRSEQRAEILNQIGRMNVLAISGGRVRPLPDGVELPVSSGYVVRVRLTPIDYYRVERVFKRGGKETLKGFCDRVDCFMVADTAYKASCYRNDDGIWTYGNPQDSGPYRDAMARERPQEVAA